MKLVSLVLAVLLLGACNNPTPPNGTGPGPVDTCGPGPGPNGQPCP